MYIMRNDVKLLRECANAIKDTSSFAIIDTNALWNLADRIEKVLDMGEELGLTTIVGSGYPVESYYRL